jgi:hypothetical protein
LPILTLSPSLWFKSILDLSLLINQFEKFYIPIIFLAAISLLIRHLPSDKKLLKLLFAVIVSFILLVRYKLSFYAIIITPLLGIIIAVLLDMSWHFITNKIPKFKIPLKITAFITMGLIIFYLFIAIAFDLSPVLTDASSSYNTVLTTINQIVPDGKIVMGPQTYWFGRVGQPYYTWEQIVFYQRYAPGVNLEEAFEQFRPQFFIIDKHLDSFIADSVSDLSEHHQFLYLSKTELEQFLYNHGILVKTIKTSNFGLIRIYRLTWP